ncbi:MAG: amino acid-binding protein [Candidatus Brocadiia bacterium]
MERTEQLSVNMANETGQLASLARVLADAGVNIIAASVHDCTEAGTVRLVADDVAGAADALTAAGMSFVRSPVLVADLPHEVGALAGMARALADEGINISYVYGSAGQPGQPAVIVVSCDDLAAAEAALS